MKLFKPEDFNIDMLHEGVWCSATDKEIAAQANARFEAWLKEQPEVFGTKYGWLEQRQTFATHRARLFAIEKIEGE